MRTLPFVVLGSIVLLSTAVQADDQASPASTAGRLNFMEENDYFVSHNDRHYTQGMRASYLSGSVTSDGFWDQPYEWLGDISPVFGGSDRKRKYEWTVAGQSLFTPSNTSLLNPSVKDRPYGAWLYTGVSLLQETNQGSHHTLENTELLVGVVGPPAFGGVTQNDFHQFVGTTSAMGWENQIKTEPGFVVSYERKWRFQQPLIGNFSIDAIPELGASGGNIMTYGEAGGMVRFGQNLAADYGADRIRPSLSGTGWFDPNQLDGNLGWYLFLGMQTRAVGHNVFLDGNTFRPSPSVDKRIFVTDFMGGASLFWSSSVRLDFTITERTKEFYGQRDAPDRFGGLNLAFQI